IRRRHMALETVQVGAVGRRPAPADAGMARFGARHHVGRDREQRADRRHVLDVDAQLRCHCGTSGTEGCDTHGALPSPLWGGVGGGGSNWRMQLCAITTTPLPSPPPQGGREQTAVAARTYSISTGTALVLRFH